MFGVLRRTMELLARDNSTVDECPDCGDSTLMGENRCPNCVGDFEDGGKIY